MDINAVITALRPFLSRVIAALISAGINWLMAKGIDLGPDAQGQLTELSLSLALASFTAIYAIIHRLLDKILNPGDAASSHMATEEKLEAKGLKDLETARGNGPNWQNRLAIGGIAALVLTMIGVIAYLVMR